MPATLTMYIHKTVLINIYIFANQSIRTQYLPCRLIFKNSWLCTTRKAFRYGCAGLDWTKPSQSPWRMGVVRWISFDSCWLHYRLERMVVLNWCFYNYRWFYQAVHFIDMRIKPNSFTSCTLGKYWLLFLCSYVVIFICGWMPEKGRCVFFPDLTATPVQQNQQCGVFNSTQDSWQSLSCESALPYVCKKTINSSRKAEPLGK